MKLTNNQEVIELDEWLDKKINFLEWALGMRSNATCQRKTRLMENELFHCRHEAVKVPDSIADSQQQWHSQVKQKQEIMGRVY